MNNNSAIENDSLSELDDEFSADADTSKDHLTTYPTGEITEFEELDLISEKLLTDPSLVNAEEKRRLMLALDSMHQDEISILNAKYHRNQDDVLGKTLNSNVPLTEGELRGFYQERKEINKKYIDLKYFTGWLPSNSQLDRIANKVQSDPGSLTSEDKRHLAKLLKKSHEYEIAVLKNKYDYEQLLIDQSQQRDPENRFVDDQGQLLDKAISVVRQLRAYHKELEEINKKYKDLKSFIPGIGWKIFSFSLKLMFGIFGFLTIYIEMSRHVLPFMLHIFSYVSGISLTQPYGLGLNIFCIASGLLMAAFGALYYINVTRAQFKERQQALSQKLVEFIDDHIRENPSETFIIEPTNTALSEEVLEQKDALNGQSAEIGKLKRLVFSFERRIQSLEQKESEDFPNHLSPIQHSERPKRAKRFTSYH